MLGRMFGKPKEQVSTVTTLDNLNEASDHISGTRFRVFSIVSPLFIEVFCVLGGVRVWMNFGVHVNVLDV